MSVRITPDPEEAERRAILQALAAEEAENGDLSPWAASSLPVRDGEDCDP